MTATTLSDATLSHTTVSHTTVSPATVPAAPRRPFTATRPAHGASLLQRWSDGRRRRRYLADKRHNDMRDRSDRYLDGGGDGYQREALVAFVQR